MAYDYEVFGKRSFAQVVNAIRRGVARSSYLAAETHLDDAVSVATLNLLEYWIPRFATENTGRNYYLAVRYGLYRAGDYLLRQGDEQLRTVTMSNDTEDPDALDLSDILADPSPTPEDQLCAEAVVANVRRLVDELDWELALTNESTRQLAKRKNMSQSTVARSRARAKHCVRSAYLACM